ncbi:ABC transporter substrate-binding protein [Brevibacillus fluminis]|uniref:ABC transporter substrate-binding protein n=1 Tax=Brevibacillus fluminis TaxID=511487 RepID=UPI003F88CC99
MKKMATRTKWLALALAGVLALAAGCGNSAAPAGEESKSKELNVFNWSNYLPESVIKQFEKESGIKVNYSTYSSNEEMLAKLTASNGVYDVAVATSYMVDIMSKQQLLDPIDLNKVPNFSNIGPDYVKKAFDPKNEFSIPYLAGNIVLAVNTDKVKTPVTSYADLWKPEFKNSVVVVDDMRGLIGMTNQMQGKSMNETDDAVLQKSKSMLVDLLPNIKAFDSDSPKTLLINGEATVGLVYGAEAALAQKEVPAIKAVYPKEGVILWMDNFVIPKGAKNKENAEAFMNFLLRPEISAEISKEIPYTNPNIKAQELLDDSIKKDPIIYPTKEDLQRGEYAGDVGDKISQLDRIWNELKSH